MRDCGLPAPIKRWIKWGCASLEAMKTMVPVLCMIGLGCSMRSAPSAEPLPVHPAEPAANEWGWVRGTPIYEVGGQSPDTLRAFGAQGLFLRWEGSGWSVDPVPTELDLTSASITDEVWVTDAAGVPWRREAEGWRPHGAGSPVLRVMGSPEGSVWGIAGSQEAHGWVRANELLRWTGASWDPLVPLHSYCVGGDVLALDRDELWSAGLECEGEVVDRLEVRRFDGDDWALVGEPVPDQGWFPSLFRVGDSVRVQASAQLEWDGAAWQPVEYPAYPQGLTRNETGIRTAIGDVVVAPRDVRCTSAFELGDLDWCWGAGQIYVRRDAAFRPTLLDRFAYTGALPRGEVPMTLWAGGDTRLACQASYLTVRSGADRGIEYFDPSEGTWHTTPVSDVVDLDCDEDRAWIASESEGLVERHWRGGLSSVRLPPELHTLPVTHVHALGGSVVAVVVNGDRLLRWNGGTWRELFVAQERWTIGEVAGTSADDLWFTVDMPPTRTPSFELHHYDGTGAVHVETVEGTVAGRNSVVTAQGQTWLLRRDYTENTIERLGSKPAMVSVDWLPYEATVWPRGDELWITTDRQARRIQLPRE